MMWRCLWAVVLGIVAIVPLHPVYSEDQVPEPLSPSEAARTMLLPKGFQAKLFAGEPDVRQPIGFCIDDRGRLWVAEAYNYPNHGTQPGDRILIFEDENGDGQFDRRTVFFEGLNYVTGIEVGFGGVWVMSPPSLLFIPNRDGDERPDGKPIVLLDGFGNHANSHNLANAFSWGPDGWLYGTHGRTNWSLIGKPGARDPERTRFDGGVYRYHPVLHIWEPFADGTTNPWSIDWDDYGQGFICNCVDPHLYFVIQGAHYEPWRNRESSQHAYQRIATIADHLHFVGKSNIREALGTPEEDQAGGGHAHCGTLVYLGDSWPDQYRNTVLMNNIHGHRINNDRLTRKGSGYVATHGPDLMKSKDPWFMGVTLQLGPDGSVFVSDWSDTGECHSVKNTRRETGRIFRISYGTTQQQPVNVAALSNLELVALQLHRNEWYVRHARRVLQERRAAGVDLSEAATELKRLYESQLSVEQQLRVFWAMHCIGIADEEFLLSQLSHGSEYVRAWVVRFLLEAYYLKQSRSFRETDQWQLRPAVSSQLIELAKSDSSAFVALHLASALQRLQFSDRWQLSEALAARREFEDDANLPLMIWYGIEPLVQVDLSKFVQIARVSNVSIVRRHIARRIASSSNRDGGLELFAKSLHTADDSAVKDILGGILVGLEGVRSTAMPQSWPQAYSRLSISPDTDVRDLAVRVALIFDDPNALEHLREIATNPATGNVVRIQALESLIAKKSPGTDAILLRHIKHPEIQRTALRGLAEFRHPETSATLIGVYSELDATARQDALLTLCSRTTWAGPLLDAVDRGQIPRTDLTAFAIRQLHSLGDTGIQERVESIWGQVRPTSAEKEQLIRQYKSRLTPETLRQSNRSAGRSVYEKVCGNCHKLFDAGGAIGPDLTGSQRTNVDYLLENIVDPSAAIVRDFQMQVITTDSGRVVSGLVISENENAITVQTTTEKVVIPKREIESRAVASVSMMPDRLLENLSTRELRDLFSYLSGALQVPKPIEANR